MTLMLQQVILTLISRRYLNGFLNGKCLLIHILPNKLKKLFFLEKWWSLVTLELNSITCLSKMLPHKKNLHKILDENLWVSSEIKMFPSWHSDVVTTLSQHYWWRCHNIVARSKVRVVPTSVSDVMTTPQSDIVKTLPQRCYNVATRLTR